MHRVLVGAFVGTVVLATGAAGPPSAAVPAPGPTLESEADFYIEVTNRSPFRVEIALSHQPRRRVGRIPPNANRRLKARWRDASFHLILRVIGAGAFENARGGAREDDGFLYTDVLTVEEEGEITLEIPARLPGPNLRVRPP